MLIREQLRELRAALTIKQHDVFTLEIEVDYYRANYTNWWGSEQHQDISHQLAVLRNSCYRYKADIKSLEELLSDMN